MIEIRIKTNLPHFDTWFYRICTGHGYEVSVSGNRYLKRYRVEHEGVLVAEIDALVEPNGDYIKISTGAPLLDKTAYAQHEIKPASFFTLLNPDFENAFGCPLVHPVNFLLPMFAPNENIADEWITPTVPPARKDTAVTELRTKPAGRKPDPENEEACQMLIDGTDEKDVFNFWGEKKGINDPKKRDRDAFKKAMNRAQERRNSRTK